MDQPTYTPVQKIVEGSGTLFFSFQDLDATKPAGSVKIRVETVAYYLERSSTAIIAAKEAADQRAVPASEPGCVKQLRCLSFPIDVFVEITSPTRPPGPPPLR